MPYIRSCVRDVSHLHHLPAIQYETSLVRILQMTPRCTNRFPHIMCMLSEVQCDLNELENWSERWQVGFSKGKCNVMHLGYNNPKYTYNTCMSDNLN